MKKTNLRLAILILILPLGMLNGCSSLTKPCTAGGDVKWYNPESPVKGTMKCDQKKLDDGKYINHGSFKEFNDDGKLVLEGQFEDGKKNGVWTQYNAKGEKIMERYFDHGIEKLAPPSESKK